LNVSENQHVEYRENIAGYNSCYSAVARKTEDRFKLLRRLVDVTGIEPVPVRNIEVKATK